MMKPIRTAALILTLGLVAGADSRGQDDPPAAPGREVVRLPDFEVVENALPRKQEAWLHGQVGPFEILSNASEKNTRGFARRFFEFQDLFRQLFPPVGSRPSVPVTLVLCGARDKFDTLVPVARPAGGTTARAGYFAADADQGVVVVDLQAEESNLFLPAMDLPDSQSATADEEGSGSSLPGSLPTVAINHDWLLYREYVHFELSRLEPRFPAWLAEGVAQLFCRMEMDPKRGVKFARLEEEFGLLFAGRWIMPMGELFTIGYDSPEFLQPVNGMFPAQALAFVHLCLYGENGRLQKPFLEFVRRLSREPATETLFQEVFGRGYRSMATDIRAYVQGGRYRQLNYQNLRPAETPAIMLRDATEAEVARIKADTLRLAGRHGEAWAELHAAGKRARSEPRMQASMGLLKRAEHEEEASSAHLVLAVAGRVEQPGPYVYLARIGLGDAGRDGAPLLSAERVAEKLALLQTAMKLPPPRPDVFQTLAEVWWLSEKPPVAADLVQLNEAVRMFTQDINLVLAAARVKQRAGLMDEARSLADLGLRMRADDKRRAEFLTLKAQLSALAPSGPDGPGH